MKYTLDELNNNYEFKITKRILKQHYPWIIDVKVNEEDLNKYDYTIFIDIYIDVDKLSEDTGVPLQSGVKYMVNRDGKYPGYSLYNFIDDHDLARKIGVDIKDKLDRINRSSSIPAHMKLKDRYLGLNDFIAIK